MTNDAICFSAKHTSSVKKYLNYLFCLLSPLRSKKYKIKMICRACMTSTAPEYIEMQSQLTDELSYFDVFATSTQLMATTGDDLPATLCLKCFTTLETTYKFIDQARKSDWILRKKVELLKKQNAEYIDEVEVCGIEELHADEVQSIEYMEIDKINEEEGFEKNIETVEANTLIDVNGLEENDEQYLIEYDSDLSQKYTGSARKWKCIECKMILRGDVSYEGHMNYHKNIRPYSCIICENYFRSKVALDKHILMYHNCEEEGVEQEIYMADAINITESVEILETSPSIENVQAEYYVGESSESNECYEKLNSTDVEEYSDQEPDQNQFGKSYNCNICKIKYRSESYLKEHYKTHLNSFHVCYIETCAKNFSSAASLRNHICTDHPDEVSTSKFETNNDAVATCPICNKKLLSKNLEKHIILHKKKEAEEMSNTPKFLCAYCPKLFQYLSGLNHHESSVHQSVYRNYICVYCDQKYLTHGELKNHTYTEHLKNNRCYVCGNIYNSKNELRWHLCLHKKKKFKYGIGNCKKAYVRRANLYIHKMTHTNRLPYKCKLCKKQYAVRGGLRYHMQRHNGIIHYCSVCPATFKSSCALKVHMFTHTGKPYRCEFCSKTYTRRKTYVDHMLCGHNRSITKKEVDDMFARNTGKVIRFNSVSSLEFSDME
ncbi:zinc finger protein 431-like isoform X1 [Teleopsis dalmanni]|uniref:zinc finger protein 431-like isoform X1 n=1 Tax=Teleopsis dalmanni TaxID=139649 RepID=UPI0018CCB128|nr:zinc finger protein 431-like isoform X1 [Teleopsis dalmanni]